MGAPTLIGGSCAGQALVDDVTGGDPDWPKLAAIPGLLEPWGDVRDKWRLATDEFKARAGRDRGACKSASHLLLAC